MVEVVEKFGVVWTKRDAKSNDLYMLKDDATYNNCKVWFMLVQDKDNNTQYLAFHKTSKEKTQIRTNIITSTYSKRQKLYENDNIELNVGTDLPEKSGKDYDTIFSNKNLYAIPEQYIDVIGKIDKNMDEYIVKFKQNSEHLLNNYLKEYMVFKNSSEYDEQYKWDYANKHKNEFDDLNNFENKITGLGNYNFKPYFLQRTGLNHLMQPYNIETFKISLKILLDESIDLEHRINTFLENLRNLLKNDEHWNNKDMMPDETDASYFLFTNDYTKYLLFNPKKAFNNFAKKFNLVDLLDKKDKVKRYIKIQDYCKNVLLPAMDRVLHKTHTLLDVQDFIWYLGNLNDDNNENDINKKEGEYMQQNIPLNQILYGPPGTGKTYNTILKAMSIIDNTEYKDVSDEQYTKLKNRFDELKQAGQIEFVTFHQSYSYEEFVEGIKPYIPEWGSSDNIEVKYIGENGIFKEICKNARQIKTDKTSHRIDFTKTRIFKMSLGASWENDTEDIYNYCLTNNVVALGWGGDKDFSNCNTPEDFRNFDSTWGAKAIEIFKTWMRVGDVILISNGNSNIKAIAQITGEYEYHKDREIRFCQFRNVNWLYSGDDIPVSKFNAKKLSQQTIYGFYSSGREGREDYNTSIKTEVLNEIITGNINNAEEKPYILIIDEINRGDVSKIFGELITLIEEDKRIGNKYQMKTTLSYSKESFGVPNNLYIIGTMNTADRSIALLDTALRRRFDFEEVMPKPELLNNKIIENINLQTLLEKINKRITNEYDRDHQIGHSYLMGVKTKEQLERAYKNRILPLLNEYFYNDSKTVAKILNCSENELNKVDFITILGNAQNDNK